jgi:hypothetical protein
MKISTFTGRDGAPGQMGQTEILPKLGSFGLKVRGILASLTYDNIRICFVEVSDKLGEHDDDFLGDLEQIAILGHILNLISSVEHCRFAD